MIDLSKQSAVLIGAGRMGGALLAGWLDRGLDASRLFVCDPQPSMLAARLIGDHGIRLNDRIADIAAAKPDVVVLATKPQAMTDLVPSLRPLVAAQPVFLSIAAGTSVSLLERLLGGSVAIVRAMPNTPASVGRGISAAFAGQRVSEVQRAMCEALLSAVGEIVWLDDETLMDAVTALSGSGPAYVFHLVEAMAAAGEELGLAPDIAMKLARATVAGAGEMLHVSAESAADLRAGVTSPGGTTAAALTVLQDDGGLKKLMSRALRAARDRSRELGQ